MSNDLVTTTLKSVSIYEVIVWIGFTFAAVFGFYKFICYLFKLFTKAKNEKDSYENIVETVNTHTDQIQTLSESDQTVYAMLEEVNAKVDLLTEALDNMKEHQDSQDRARLKDRIRVIYQQHHQTQEITRMELESLEELISNYEAAGGTNSFVHTTVQPEIYNWKQLP